MLSKNDSRFNVFVNECKRKAELIRVIRDGSICLFSFFTTYGIFVGNPVFVVFACVSAETYLIFNSVLPYNENFVKEVEAQRLLTVRSESI